MFLCFRCTWCSRVRSCPDVIQCTRGEDLPCFLCDHLDSDCIRFDRSDTRIHSFYDSLESFRKEVQNKYDHS